MVAKVFKDVAEVIDEYSGRSRTVLEYSLLMKQLVDAAKQPGGAEPVLAALSALVAVDEFERVGNFKEVMTWADYSGFLVRWASGAEWDGSFKRITESDDVVFLELEERSGIGEHTSVVNSMSVYEFDEAGKIRHLDIYLQMKPMNPEMLTSYNAG